jgi:TolB-like protein/DNA-binding winged helix-turn-helix (wHTH) protein/Flp pilus assembly protein TadD
MGQTGTSGVRRTYRFGEFELDAGTYQLRRRGRRVRLERRPLDLLILLVERHGQLVTRAEIVDLLWGKDVFVEVETGIHTAIRKIRQALRDSPDAPAFIETVPARGYRFIGHVESGSGDPAAVAPTSRHPLVVAVPFLLAFVAALAGWWWLRAGTTETPVRLAVLPFADLSADPERAYLADGLVDEIIASLGQTNPERLRVIGRTSTLTYKGTTKPLAQIGKELAVDYLVEGSVRAEKDRLRITVKLIRAADEVQVWSDSYDHDLSSLLTLQRELSTAIAGQVRLQLTPELLGALARRHTQDAEAYDLYLRGRSVWHRRTAESNVRAIEYFNRATVRDPRFALAWSGIADARLGSTINADLPPLTVGPQARGAASHASEIEPGLAEAQYSRGYVSFLLDWDWPAAEMSFRRSIAINPGFSLAHLYLGHVLSQMRRHAEAQSETRRAAELDPLNPMNHAIASQVAFQARDYPAALEYAKRAATLDPEFWIGYMQLSQVYEQLGKTDLAVEAAIKAARLSGGNSKAHAIRGYILARTGQIADAREVLEALEVIGRERFVPPSALALVHAGLGDRDAAFAWLAKAYDVRDVHLIFLPVDPKWDPYRNAPRFVALLKRCGFHVEQ